ncbi:DME family drug/metabolite transporter [Kribbella rubisoli]|uniref:DME family drug/metabolite transporter n=2 Tax=Kribbella rubisoli TaxID=3075929 RepID=A0A4Q7XMY7_9ACTN|nr:DME family drug/metabolite transporter [Kribbella rubisoli]
MHSRLSTRRALILMSAAALAWGTGGPTGALLGHTGLTPTATSFWRLATAALWLAIARRITGRGPARPVFTATPLRHLASGAGLALCQLGYFAAIPRVGVGIATVIALGAAPILITFAARERLTPAVLAAITGLTLLTATTGTTNLTGIAAALASAVGYTATTILNRNTPDPLTTAYLGFATGAAFLLPFAALPTTLSAWLLIAYFGLIPTALAYTLFYKALTTLKASTTALIALIEPVVATALGLLLFQEHLTTTSLIGAAVLLAAIATRASHE